MALITSTSSIPAPSSTQAEISLHQITNTTTCNASIITWDYPTPRSGLVYFRLVVTNIGIPEKLVEHYTPPPVNVTLINQMNAIAGGYNWNPVNVSEGWYVVEALFTSGDPALSNTFFVTNGTDTSCLMATTPNGSSQSQSSTSSSPSLSSSSSSSSLSLASNLKHNTAGIVAGSVVGTLMFIGIVLFVFFFMRRRRKYPQKRSTRWPMPPTTEDRSGTFSRGNHSHTESTGAIVVAAPSNRSQVNHSSQSSSEHMTAEELSIGIEKMVVNYNDKIAALPVQNISPSSSSLAHSEFGFSPQEPGVWSAGLQSRDSASRSQNQQRPDNILPSISTDAHSLKALDRSSYGRRSSRKPVPAYDASELESVAADGGQGHQAASHNSRIEFGEKPVHYLFPEPPPHAQ
jgi:hypothetical protein